ncbi:MAG: hypothetical protein KAR55_00260 [Thermoplasmatales archaeon]|nr:hypothetical protein [Thermoplasmatales archaeon]
MPLLYMYWFLYAVVLNDGDGEVPGGTERTLRCVAMRPISRRVVVDYSHTWAGGTYPIPLGGISHDFFLGVVKPSAPLGLYKVYFEVDPDHAIDESNEDNNVVWAYYILFFMYTFFSPRRLTNLRQCSKIPMDII